MGNLFSYDSQLIDFDQLLLKDNSKQWSQKVGESYDGMTDIIRNVDSPDKIIDSWEINEVKINTLLDIFKAGYSYSNGSNPCYGTRQYIVASDEEVKEYAEHIKSLKSLPRGYVATGYKERQDHTVYRGDYIWQSYEEIKKLYEAFGRGILASDCLRDGDDVYGNKNVGIFSINRVEWILASFGLFSQSCRVVPLYPTLGPDALQHTICHAELQTAIVSIQNFDTLVKVLDECTNKGKLKNIVILDAILDGKFGNTLDVITDKMKEAVKPFNINLVSFQSILELGLKEETKEKYPLKEATGEDLAFIMYTSGTTGTPKGVMLSHRNFVTPIIGMLHNTPIEKQNLTNPVYISFLPLSHCFEWSALAFSLCFGAALGASQGDIRYLKDDIEALRPHIMPGVPRVFGRFYQGVMSKVEKKNFLLRYYFHRAYNYQLQQIYKDEPLDPTYDERVFKPIRELIGLDRIRIMVSGGAPTPPYIFNFMLILTGGHATFGIGYGMTESSSGIAVSNNRRACHAGAPLVCNEVALLDIEDMAYLSTDKPYPRGEIIAHGYNTFQGYYKDPKATEEAYYITPDGRKWLRTGDVGRLNPNGTISVIDRKKNLIKLSQGEYVALERIEDDYSKVDFLMQIWCYGNAYKTCMVAVIVPNAHSVYQLAVEKGWWKESDLKPTGSLSTEFIEYYKSVAEEHREELQALTKSYIEPINKSLLGFERIRNFYLEFNIDSLGLAFTEENGTLTPTMKKKRKQLVEKYADILEQLYTEIGEPSREGERY